MQCFNELKTALLSCTDAVYHFAALKQSTPFIVWSETGQTGASTLGDDIIVSQTIGVNVFLATKSDADTLPDAVQEALNAAEIPFTLDSVSFDPTTGIIEYRWSVEVVNALG